MVCEENIKLLTQESQIQKFVIDIIACHWKEATLGFLGAAFLAGAAAASDMMIGDVLRDVCTELGSLQLE